MTDAWFVWERTMQGFYQAAIYRDGLPRDGNGKVVGTNFAFKKQLHGIEAKMFLDDLKVKYACPVGTIEEPKRVLEEHNPRQPANLNKGILADDDPIEKFFPRV